MLAQSTVGAARAIVRNEDTENGFEIWRRLQSVLTARKSESHSLLTEIISFRLRNDDHLESDVIEFMILQNRHAKTTGSPLSMTSFAHVVNAEVCGSIAAAFAVECS